MVRSSKKRSRVEDGVGEELDAFLGGASGGGSAGTGGDVVIVEGGAKSKFVRVTAPCALGDVPEDSEVVIVRVPAWFDWSRLNGVRMPTALLDGVQRTALVGLGGVGGVLRAELSGSQCLRVGVVRKPVADDVDEDEDEGESARFEVLKTLPTALLNITDAQVLSAAGCFFKPVTLTSRAPVTSLALPIQAQMDAPIKPKRRKL